jgi:Ca-activated chloride channel family protein
MAGDQNSFLSFNAALTYNAVAPAGLERRWRKPTESSGAAVSYIGCWSCFLKSRPQVLSIGSSGRLLACAVAFCFCSSPLAQGQGDSSQPSQGLPFLNTGADSVMSQIDMVELYVEQQNKHTKFLEEQKLADKKLIDSGVVSALDLDAPNGAIEDFNRARTLLKAQNSKEAIKQLQKAIAGYPKFVSAHVGLGLAYVDQEDPVKAKSEFETAAKLDDKFPGSFLHLGRLALSQNDFPAAESALEKAAALQPKDVNILSVLAYAQNGTHQYGHALETAQLVHTLDHKGMANVHYVAASAAMSLKDFEAMERELKLFLSEDPTNAFAPVARKNLAALEHNKAVRAAGAANSLSATTVSVSQAQQTFPNTDRLKAQLATLGDESDSCDDCGALAEADAPKLGGDSGAVSDAPRNVARGAGGVWTIRKNVDDVALFFSVSSHGHMVNDLEASNIKIRDDNKPPARVVQFAPQSKLPLRLALLVDTSGSVHNRFSFEKSAATKFVQKVLSNPADLGFIAGFASEPSVTQDFSADPIELGKGIDNLANGGGTALFDAVLFACRKLGAYPDDERVARVLVILSDGEDNSSHGTLKQSIRVAEKTGVTIYTVSTKEGLGDKTDADKVLEVLAERTGGEAMFPGDLRTLGSSLDKLRDLIRSRYFIAYKPADFQPNGNYHTISIIAEKNGKHLQVRARKGYHARLEASPN